jgi:geranylgeranyl pyrophosphate synthase
MLKRELANYQERIDQQLKGFIQQKKNQHQSKIGKELINELERIIKAGGKRVRPFVCAKTFALTKGKNQKKILPACLGIELYHTGALIHDDILDQAEKRRGVETINGKKGAGFAMLAGDLAFSFADNCFHQLPEDVYAFCQLFKDECFIGEAIDISMQEDASEQEILQMLELKSARYTIGRPMQIGAQAGKAAAEAVKKLFQIGNKIGMVFQIKDDLLDLFGKEKIGKTIGGDISEGKQTLLVANLSKKKAQLSQQEQQQFFEIFGQRKKLDKDQILFCRGLLRKTGALKQTEEQMNNYAQQAKQEIKKLDLKDNFFIQLIDYVVEREQ